MDFSNLTDHEIKELLLQYDSEMRKLSFQMQIVQGTIQRLHEKLSGIAPMVNTAMIQKNVEKVASVVSETTNVTTETKERKKPGPKPKTLTAVAETTKVETKVEGNNEEPVVKRKRGRQKGFKLNRNKSQETVATEPKQKGRKKKATEEVETPEKRKYTKNNPWPNFIKESLAKYNHVLSSAQIYELAEEENGLRKYGLERQELRDMISRALHQLANNKRELVKFDLEAGKGYNYALKHWVEADGDLKEAYIV